MFKKIFIFLIFFNTIQGNEMQNKPEINFYTDKKHKLMWLINKNTPYLAPYTLKWALNKGYSNGGYSYELYLNKVNNDPKFKYNDWRLPTKDELLTLEYKGFFLKGWLMSKEKKKKLRAIDTDIFYDHPMEFDVVGYWSNTKCTKSGEEAFILVEFGARYSYKASSTSTHLGESTYSVTPGVFEKCDFVDTSNLKFIRLVRDIKE